MTLQSSGAGSAIQIANLVKQFGSFTAVDHIDITVPKGAFLVLVGPSGCGKSTLLRMLAGLDEPTEGEIAFMGQTVSSGTGGVVADPRQRNAGLVFQSYALWPHMTVANNISWPLKVAKWSAELGPRSRNLTNCFANGSGSVRECISCLCFLEIKYTYLALVVLIESVLTWSVSGWRDPAVAA